MEPQQRDGTCAAFVSAQLSGRPTASPAVPQDAGPLSVSLRAASGNASLRSLLDVLEQFQPKLGRHELPGQEDQWQDDELRTAIGSLSGRALGSTAPLALPQHIFAALRQHESRLLQ